jgi:hypothetical protein
MNATEIISERRVLQSFDQVVLRGNMCCVELTLEQSDSESLTLEGERMMMERVDCIVRQGRLFIRVGGTWMDRLVDFLTHDFSQPELVMHLRLKNIHVLDLYSATYVHGGPLETESLRISWRGAGQLELDSFKAKRFEFSHSGAGTAQIAGQVDEQIVRVNGVGRYEGSGLKSLNADVRVDGTSIASVAVDGTLRATARGVGVIEYAGTPKLSIRTIGMGSIVRVA